MDAGKAYRFIAQLVDGGDQAGVAGIVVLGNELRGLGVESGAVGGGDNEIFACQDTTREG